jgi:hemoglobin
VSAGEIEHATERDDHRSGTLSDEPARTATPYYEQIGGAPTIRVAVDKFYEKVLNDPDLAPYFTMTNMPRLKRHQVQLLTTALGGPDEYEGRDLTLAHRGRGISEPHYAKVAEHLAATLRELDAPAEVVTAVATTLDSLREQIVERPAAPAPRSVTAGANTGQEAP